jgi:hypothetical protein
LYLKTIVARSTSSADDHPSITTSTLLHLSDSGTAVSAVLVLEGGGFAIFEQVTVNNPGVKVFHPAGDMAAPMSALLQTSRIVFVRISKVSWIVAILWIIAAWLNCCLRWATPGINHKIFPTILLAAAKIESNN